MTQEHDGIEGWLPALAAVGALVNSSATLPEVLNAVAQTACELMGVNFCAVAVPDEQRRVLKFEGSYGLSADYVSQVNSTKPIRITDSPDAAPSTQAFLSGKAVQIVDTLTHPSFSSWSGVAQEQGFVSMVSVPLLAAEEVLGTLNCYTSARRDFSGEMPLLYLLADQAAVSIASASLQLEQQRTIRRLNEANWTLERQHELQRQAAAIHDKLTELSLEGGGVPALAEALAELLHRPIAIRGATGELIHATTSDPDKAPPLARAGNSDVKEAGSAASALDAISSPVVIQGETVAWICARTSESRLAPLDLRAIEHTSTVLALELLRSRAAAEAEWRDSDEILAALIRGDARDLQSLTQRALRLGHGIGQVPHALIVLRQRDPSSELSRLRLAEAFRELSKDIQHRPLLGLRDGVIVALWPFEPGATNDVETIVGSIRRACGLSVQHGEDILAATVGPSVSLNSVPSGYRIARGAVELAALRSLPDGVRLPSELGAAGLLLQVDNVPELERHMRAILGPIIDYDSQHGSKLLETLTILLENDLSANAAAKGLFIHKNTVVQRRHRIEELLQRNLSQVWDLTEVAMAVRIEQMLRVLSPDR